MLPYHEGPKPTAVTGIPGGMRTDAEIFWDTVRELSEKKETEELYQHDHEASLKVNTGKNLGRVLC